MTQFSLFGAAAADPTLEDLDGLLLAGAGWVRSPAGTRLSVVVGDRWRADELHRVFVTLGVGGAADATISSATGGLGVRTVFSSRLRPHAERWTRGAHQGLPRPFALSATGLRWWATAAGHRDDTGFVLATPRAGDDTLHQAAGAELSRLGVAAVSLSQRGGPGWRVTSVRRLRRLSELLGPAPPGAGDQWPASSAAAAR